MGPNVDVTCVVAAELTTNVSLDGTDGLKVDVETSILSCLPDWGFLPAAVSDVDSALGGATQLGVLLNLGRSSKRVPQPSTRSSPSGVASASHRGTGRVGTSRRYVASYIFFLWMPSQLPRRLFVVLFRCLWRLST